MLNGMDDEEAVALAAGPPPEYEELASEEYSDQLLAEPLSGPFDSGPEEGCPLLSEERVLLAASEDAERAASLQRVKEGMGVEFSTPILEKVYLAVVQVHRASGGRQVSRQLVVERLEGDAPAWLSSPTDEELRWARSSFGHDLVYLGERAQALTAQRLAAQALEDIRNDGMLSSATRRGFREVAAFPAPLSAAQAVPTDFRAVAQRARGTEERLFWGFRPLDNALAPRGGLPRGIGAGNLVVVGAETGVGKTTFSVEVALRATSILNRLTGSARSVLVYSAEQTAEDMALLAGLVPGGRWWGWWTTTCPAEVHFVDRAACRASVDAVVADVVTRVTASVRFARQAGVSVRATLPAVVVVDYAKLYAPRDRPLVQGIEEVAALLKTELCLGGAFDLEAYPELAGYNPVVILPTQVKRPKTLAKADRQEWRPDIDDLADCRGIVDFADYVLLLYREAERAEARFVKTRRCQRPENWIPLAFSEGVWRGDGHEPSPEGVCEHYAARLALRRAFS
jgi:hypothetical protein